MLRRSGEKKIKKKFLNIIPKDIGKDIKPTRFLERNKKHDTKNTTRGKRAKKQRKI